jgi:4-amino-4-deoxychorismate lyase
MESAEKAGIPVSEVDIKVEDLLKAQAVCLTNALMGIVPVKQFQSTVYPQSSFAVINQLQSLLTAGED